MSRVLASVLLLLLSVAALAQQPPDKKDAELKWAREIASDFLSAGLRQDHVQASVLVASDLKKAVEKDRTTLDSFLSSHFSTLRMQGAKTWTFASEIIAPDKDEAVFRGQCTGDTGEADITVRVVKEKESGKWRVHLFAIGRWKKKKDSK